MTTTGDCPKRDEKMNPVLYFAYGSNLDDAQMRERCANARVVGRATLPNYALVFGGFSHRWGGAVASVVRAKGACVEGLLYDPEDPRGIDQALITLLDPNVRARMGAAARARVTRDFSWDAHCRALDARLRALVA